MICLITSYTNVLAFPVYGKANPTAYMSGYHHICAGTQATIPVYLTNGPIWDVTFTDGLTQWTVTGITSSPYNLVVSPSAIRTYSVVSVTAAGCVGTGSGAATVIIDPAPQIFTISCATPTFCAGSSSNPILLNGSEDGVIYNLIYNNNVVSMIIGNGSPIQFPGQTLPGIYTIEASSPTANCTATIGSITLTTSPLPSVAGAITGPTDVCQNTTITYTTTAITNANSYTWSVPTWTTIVSGQGTNQITLLVNQAGISGNITVMGQNACGGGTISNIALNVMAAPIINATATPNVVCAGNSVTLNSGGNATSYTWSNGLGSNSSITINPTTTTTYYVTATGSNGCIATDDIVVTVNPLPNVSLTLIPNSVCQGEYSITLMGGSPAGGTYIGGCISGTNIVYPASVPVNTYGIQYTYIDPITGCSNTSNLDHFTVNPEPWVDFDPFYPGAVIPLDEPAFIVSSGTPYGGTYNGPGFSQIGNSWWFNAANAGIGTHTATYTYTQPSTGCDGNEYRVYTVGPAGNPDNPTKIDEATATVNAIGIFPNPTNNYLNLHGINTQKITSLVIIDITGRIVFEQQNLNEDMQLDVANFVPGTYFIRFTDIDGFSVSKKFMKSR